MCLLGCHAQSIADVSHHSPPSSQLASGRECAAVACGHMGCPNLYPAETFSIGFGKRPVSTAAGECGSLSIWECGAVIYSVDPAPRVTGVGAGRLENRQQPQCA